MAQDAKYQGDHYKTDDELFEEYTQIAYKHADGKVFYRTQRYEELKKLLVERRFFKSDQLS